MKKALIIIISTMLSLGAIFGVLAVINIVNAEAMYKYIDTFSAVETEKSLTPEQDADGAYYFTTDGDFKVLRLTDLHFCGGFLSTEKDKKAINAVAAMVTAEKPDLVIITGDISFAVPWYGTINNVYGHNYAKRLFEKLGVWWTVTLGNHDSEAYNFYSRSAVAEMYEDESLKYCLFDRGPEGIFGEGNHYINVKNSDGLITRSLIMMDSNAYTDEDPLGIKWIYDNIHADQLEWYKSVVAKNNARNADILGEDAPAVKSSLYIHIPISAVKTAYDEYVANGRENTENVTYIGGHDGESAPVVWGPSSEDGVLEVLIEQGSCDSVFYGHDHLNNFTLEYKGVTLSYGYSIDYSAYTDIDLVGYQRGCTVVTYTPDSGIAISNENYYQDKYPSLYEKETVDMTPAEN